MTPPTKDSQCECECKLFVLTAREPTWEEWVILHNLPWGAQVVVAQVLYLGITLTSREAWRQLDNNVREYRSNVNFRSPIAKAEERVGLFVRVRLSVTSRGQVWNTYIVTLFS